MKTSKLSGVALDWAVAVAEKETPVYLSVDKAFKNRTSGIYIGDYSPSTNWEQGGPIIEREEISIELVSGEWVSQIHLNRGEQGPTPLIAAMRCYVASKLGDEIDIPEELK